MHMMRYIVSLQLLGGLLCFLVRFFQLPLSCLPHDYVVLFDIIILILPAWRGGELIIFYITYSVFAR